MKTGSGNEDGRAFEVQQVLVVLELFHGIQVFEPDGWSPADFRALASLSQQSSMSWYSRVIWMPSGESMNTGTPGLMRVQFIDQFLGPAQGKCRDIYDTAV